MIAFMVVQAVVSTGEVYYVGFLGADALAGVAVSYPLVMLMTTMSAGGMGGGMASAVARALGAGRTDEARRLVVHALVIAVAMGILFTVGVLLRWQAAVPAAGGGGGLARDGLDLRSDRVRRRGHVLVVQCARERLPGGRRHGHAGDRRHGRRRA